MNYVAKAKMPILLWELVIFAAFAVLGLLVNKWFHTGTGLTFLFFLFTMYFFRNPERITPNDENLIISPADGEIIKICDVEDNVYFKKKVKQISIFMSVFSVHVNRSPITGKIVFKKYFPGKYFKAFEDKASVDNEQTAMTVQDSLGRKIMFKMIAGIIARRVVTIVEEGDSVKAGERIGLIKFGSRVDILTDEDIEINVKLGDKTAAGETVIGRFKK